MELLVLYGRCAFHEMPALRQRVEAVHGYELMAKVPPAGNAGGRFSKDRFDIYLTDQTVTCPAGQRVAITPRRRGGGTASFAPHCDTCPLRPGCTVARQGRSITIHAHEARLQAAKTAQATPEWAERYRADRPIVERKIAHLVRRVWGGRNARCRGLARVSTDVETRGGAINLARLAVLGLGWSNGAWSVAGA